MRVSRLELFGFKSFMDRVVLPLDGGITGVVGPNGCGKSNIVDALRWVLGETRARSLRGESLEDVIFNGTDNLRPLGLAEVTLTIRSQGESVLADLADVEGGEHEVVSLLDETDTYLAKFQAEKAAREQAEKGAEALAVEEASTEGSERPKLTVIRGALSEQESEPREESVVDAEPEGSAAAATQPKETSRALFASRFAWLGNTSEVQVTRRLYRSGESEFFINRVPCRLRDIRDLLRAINISARAYTVVAQGEVSRIISAKPEEIRLLLEEASGIVGLRDRMQAAVRRLEETRTNVTRIDDVVREVSRQVASLKRQAQRAQNRQALKDEIRTLDEGLFRDAWVTRQERIRKATEQVTALKTEEDGIYARLQRAQAEEQEVRSLLLTLDIEGDDVRQKVEALQEERANRLRRQTERQSKLAELKGQKDSAQREVERLAEREQLLNERKTQTSSHITELRQHAESLQHQVSGTESRVAGDIREVEGQIESKRDELRQAERARRELRESLVAAQTRLRSAEQQLLAASPVEQLKRTLGSERANSLVRGTSLVVDTLQVPESLEVPVQAALRESAQFIMSDDIRGVGKSFLETVLSRGNDEGLGLGLVSRGESSTAGIAEQFATDEVTPILRGITVKPEGTKAARHLLGHCLVSENVESAIAFFVKNESAPGIEQILVVTKDGDRVTSQTFASFRHGGGIVRLRNAVDRLRTSVVELEGQVRESEARCSAIEGELQGVTTKLRELMAQREAERVALRELTDKLARSRGAIESEERLLNSIGSDIVAIGREREKLLQRDASRDAEIAKIKAELEANSGHDGEELVQEIQKLKAIERELDEKRKAGRERLSAASSGTDGVRAELEGSRQKKGQFTLQVEREQLEERNLRDQFVREYGRDMFQSILDSLAREEQVVTLTDDAREEMTARAQRIRERIAREGEVDSSSIEAYEVEQKRLTDLEAQREDLARAIATLERTVERLRETARERFQKTFEAVAENFSKLAPRLFGGGKAFIELTEPTRPLDGGVRVVVRPPGKKPNSIELLSGGEKALSAVALIFAMFLVRPSPLCVLDEVDAPLDEANLVRFISMVKEMSSSTQFIVITHSKQSMAASDRLVGVTMKQPGASQVVTVSLDEAYQQVA